MSDDLRTLLLQSLAGREGGGVDAQKLLLSQLGEGEPTAGLLARYLAGQREAAEETDSEDEAAREQERAERVEAFKRLRTHLEHMYAELELLRDRNEQLSAALGACTCWGDDPDCPVCGGEGGPGWEEPDLPLLRDYVRPALRHLRARRPAQSAIARKSAGGPRGTPSAVSRHERRPA